MTGDGASGKGGEGGREVLSGECEADETRQECQDRVGNTGNVKQVKERRNEGGGGGIGLGGGRGDVEGVYVCRYGKELRGGKGDRLPQAAFTLVSGGCTFQYKFIYINIYVYIYIHAVTVNK